MSGLSNTIDDDLNFILNGGAKSKSKSKQPSSKSKSKQPSSKSKSKQPSSKSKSKSKSKKHLKVVEAGKIIMDDDNNTKSEETTKQHKIKPTQERPRVVKKNADENKEYISVKTEKPTKSDNTYKDYDVAFLKRMRRSHMEAITDEEPV